MPGPYELYLIRHGVAEERGDAWPDDSKRPLTEEGMSRMRKAARGLSRLGILFDIVLTSPLVRARQTAEIVAGGLAPRPTLANIDALAPGGGFAALMTELEKHVRKPRIALVGHEPDIGELGARLTGLRRSIEFKKGAICRIEIDDIRPAAPASCAGS